MELISVIVPVYKVEQYLDRCIKSIVNQTYQNLEIILVEDGSPDKCSDICDEWAKKDKRIKVIHQTNAGGGSARNTGLDIATGELIAFVDSDDYISADMMEYLYELVQKGFDIAECSYIDVFNDNEIFIDKGSKTTIYGVEEAMQEHIQDQIFRQLIWNKLYRREVIKGIRFPIGKKIDDEFFTYQVLGNATKLIHSERVCYAYRQQDNSVMHAMKAKDRIQAIEAKIQRHEYLKKRFFKLISFSANALCMNCIYQGQVAMRDMDKELRNATFRYLKKIIKEYSCDIKNQSIKEHFWIGLSHVSLKFTCRLRNLLHIGL